MKKILALIILTVLICSFISACHNSNDSLNSHKGEIVAQHGQSNDYRENDYRNTKYLYLKQKDKVDLFEILVNEGEYHYYKDGDTLK